MISPVVEPSTYPPQQVQEQFLALLPQIQRHVSIAFRNLRGAERDEQLAEALARAFYMFRRLADRGRLDKAYPTALARYAVAQVLAGRRLGSKLNVCDVTSTHCQKIKRVKVESGQPHDSTSGDWLEMIDDRRATPAEIACCRIDFREWLRRLNAPLRRIAKTLATGESTLDAAQRHGVSPGRISQIRGQLRESWEMFQGAPADSSTAVPAIVG